MGRIVIVVPGRIGGKQRAGRRRLIDGNVISFNPRKTKRQEELIQHHALLAMRNHRFQPLLFGPLHLMLSVMQTPPPSWSARRKREVLWVTGRPDVDNIAKLCADALNFKGGQVVWTDDSQIAQLSIARIYGERDEVVIEIEPLEHESFAIRSIAGETFI